MTRLQKSFFIGIITFIILSLAVSCKAQSPVTPPLCTYRSAGLQLIPYYTPALLHIDSFLYNGGIPIAGGGSGCTSICTTNVMPVSVTNTTTNAIPIDINKVTLSGGVPVTNTNFATIATNTANTASNTATLTLSNSTIATNSTNCSVNSNSILTNTSTIVGAVSAGKVNTNDAQLLSTGGSTTANLLDDIDGVINSLGGYIYNGTISVANVDPSGTLSIGAGVLLVGGYDATTFSAITASSITGELEIERAILGDFSFVKASSLRQLASASMSSHTITNASAIHALKVFVFTP